MKERIVRYWQSVELLNPQKIPKRKEKCREDAPFVHDVTLSNIIMPWDADSPVQKQSIPKKRVWSHAFFGCIHDIRQITNYLNATFHGEKGYSETKKQEASVFCCQCTFTGSLVHQGITISSAAWFVGRVLHGQDWTHGFKELESEINDQCRGFVGASICAEKMQMIAELVLESLGVSEFFAENRENCRFCSTPIDPNTLDTPCKPLNSFILDDLAHIANQIQQHTSSAALDAYLQEHSIVSRQDVKDTNFSAQAVARLMPACYPHGCWPTKSHYDLLYSQQLAVNTVLSTLTNKPGILGINGPPGTGKTTLLRDVIAAVITQRADVLAKFARASDAFDPRAPEEIYDNGQMLRACHLDSALFGFEIAITSSNNKAVENITKELPQLDAIDHSWQEEADIFSDIASNLIDQPAWGLISAALGSKSRRMTFIEKYYWGVTSGSEKKTGLRAWLGTQIEINKNRTADEKQTIWKQAVMHYLMAKKHAEKCLAQAGKMSDFIAKIQKIDLDISTHTDTLQQLEKQLSDIRAQQRQSDAQEADTITTALQRALYLIEKHTASAPSLWTNICTLWSAHRKWTAQHRVLESRYAIAQHHFDEMKERQKKWMQQACRVEKQLDTNKTKREVLRHSRESIASTAAKHAETWGAEHLATWFKQGMIPASGKMERMSPWSIPEWRRARARVFLEARKLHYQFLLLEPSRMYNNLTFINALLMGAKFKNVSRQAIRSAWSSLCMVVPVLSSTFSSFARTFGSCNSEEIGWLFIDEAGQATPQAAVGALWRAQRVVCVGDPLQLQPIVPVSDAVLEHMRTYYQITPYWIPSRQSAQTLADNITPFGTMAGPAGEKRWVGLPLVVHRRCDHPMFTIANTIAYDGAMVYGTVAPHPELETRAHLQTGWIDAPGPSEENWVPAEGRALDALLTVLQNDGVEMCNIALITPFLDVSKTIETMQKAKKCTIGTIHTMQGKESEIVICILGGNASSASSGARNWVVESVNTLNVAVTRAKRRLYIIGDRSDWKKRRLFCDIMHILPVIKLPMPQENPATEEQKPLYMEED